MVSFRYLLIGYDFFVKKRFQSNLMVIRLTLEARTVFAGLFAIYVLFFNFCNDMNDPFDGVYQIKRSSAASYLLQIKWLVANQPWGKDIMFDTRAAFVPEFDADLVEVTSNDNRKSLASTIEEMERAENTIAATALNADTFEQEKVTLNGAYDVSSAKVLKKMRVNSSPPVMTVVTIPPSSDTFEEGRAPVNGAHVSSISTQI